MSLFSELKRRNIFRTALLYVVASWLVLQVGELLFDLMGLPEVALRMVLGILLLGFPIVLVFAWAYEITPEGIKREAEVQRSESRTTVTAKKLDIGVIVLLVVGIGVVLADRLYDRPTAVEPTRVSEQTDVLQEPAPAVEPTVSADSTAAPETRLTGDKSIAVLPFANMSTDPENEFFADGVSEEILNRLAQVPRLRVIARTSSFAFKNDNRDLREIGKTLDSTYILEGSVRRQGDQARITAQLIDSRDGSHLWSEAYDREISDVFEAQDQIALAVTEAMNVVLDDSARQAMRNAGVRNVDAFIAYQKGMEAYQQAHDSPSGGRVADALVEANALFDQAISAAPEFAEAYLQKSDRYAHIVLEPRYNDVERKAALETMQSLTAQAVEHSRDPARKAWARVDSILFSDNWAGLRAAVEQALSVRSCTVGNWLELVEPFAYRDEITAYAKSLTECNPLAAFPYTFVARGHLLDGNPEAALAVLDRGESNAGEHRWLSTTRMETWLAMGDFQSARAYADSEALNRDPGWKLRTNAYISARQGDTAQAQALFTQAEQLEGEVWGPVRRIQTAAVLGDLASANQAAAELDARPGGYAELIRNINVCGCGAPFSLDATPNLARRLQQADFPWPPEAMIKYPAKDW